MDGWNASASTTVLTPFNVHEAGLIHDKLPGHFATRIKHPGGKRTPCFSKMGCVDYHDYWLKWGCKMSCDFLGWHA